MGAEGQKLLNLQCCKRRTGQQKQSANGVILKSKTKWGWLIPEWVQTIHLDYLYYLYLHSYNMSAIDKNVRICKQENQ